MCYHFSGTYDLDPGDIRPCLNIKVFVRFLSGFCGVEACIVLLGKEPLSFVCAKSVQVPIMSDQGFPA